MGFVSESDDEKATSAPMPKIILKKPTEFPVKEIGAVSPRQPPADSKKIACRRAPHLKHQPKYVSLRTAKVPVPAPSQSALVMPLPCGPPPGRLKHVNLARGAPAGPLLVRDRGLPLTAPLQIPCQLMHHQSPFPGHPHFHIFVPSLQQPTGTMAPALVNVPPLTVTTDQQPTGVGTPHFIAVMPPGVHPTLSFPPPVQIPPYYHSPYPVPIDQTSEARPQGSEASASSVSTLQTQADVPSTTSVESGVFSSAEEPLAPFPEIQLPRDLMESLSLAESPTSSEELSQTMERRQKYDEFVRDFNDQLKLDPDDETWLERAKADVNTERPGLQVSTDNPPVSYVFTANANNIPDGPGTITVTAQSQTGPCQTQTVNSAPDQGISTVFYQSIVAAAIGVCEAEDDPDSLKTQPKTARHLGKATWAKDPLKPRNAQGPGVPRSSVGAGGAVTFPEDPIMSPTHALKNSKFEDPYVLLSRAETPPLGKKSDPIRTPCLTDPGVSSKTSVAEKAFDYHSIDAWWNLESAPLARPTSTSAVSVDDLATAQPSFPVSAPVSGAGKTAGFSERVLDKVKELYPSLAYSDAELHDFLRECTDASLWESEVDASAAAATLIHYIGYRRGQRTEKQQDCAICGKSLEGSGVVVKTACGHYFHELCLVCWVAGGNPCPVESCGADLVGKIAGVKM